MQPMDVKGRKILAAERFELLRSDARPTGGVPGQLRRGLGRLLVAAGRRLAPDAVPRSALVGDAAARRVPTSQG